MEQPKTYSAVAVSHPDEGDLSRIAGGWDTHLEVTVSRPAEQTSGPTQEVSAWEAAWQEWESLPASSPATVILPADFTSQS
jgi:hypothetical protein